MIEKKLNRAIILFPLIILLLLANCKQDESLHKIKKTDFAMGTIIQITVLDSSEAEGREAIELAMQEINRIGNLFYKGNPESPIYKFNHRKTRQVKMPVEVLDLISRGADISSKTEGCFDMTIEKLLPYYKFEGDSLKPPPRAIIDSLLQYIDYRNLKIDKCAKTIIAKDRETVLATGGNAKGYAVDRAIHILDSLDVCGALVNAGGDLRVLPRADGKKWTVGIQDPRNRNMTIDIIALDSGAVTTSGDYEQYFMYKGTRYHHIINPKTGFPARASRATTVISPTTELADALATGLFILGYKKGLQVLSRFPNCHAFWIDSTGARHSSPGFERYIKNGP